MDKFKELIGKKILGLAFDDNLYIHTDSGVYYCEAVGE